MMFFRLICLLFAFGLLLNEAPAQSAAGRVTTSAPTYGDGTTAPLSLDTAGSLRVRPAGTATSAADDIATSTDNAKFVGWLYGFDGTTWDRIRATAADGVLVNLGSNNDVTITGSVTVTDGSGALNVIVDSGTVTTVSTVTAIGTSVTPGTSAGHLGKAEDAVAGSGDTGVMALGVRTDTPAAPGGNGDYAPFLTNSVGQLWIAGTGTTAAAVPASASYTGVNVGGNLTGLVGCNSSAKIDTASAGNVELVALSASTVIRVCGYNFIANGTVAVQMIYGTGTACATGETDLTGAYNLTAQSGIVVQSPFWTGMATAAGNALCIELSGAVQVSGVVFYTQY